MFFFIELKTNYKKTIFTKPKFKWLGLTNTFPNFSLTKVVNSHAPGEMTLRMAHLKFNIFAWTLKGIKRLKILVYYREVTRFNFGLKSKWKVHRIWNINLYWTAATKSFSYIISLSCPEVCVNSSIWRTFELLECKIKIERTHMELLYC